MKIIRHHMRELPRSIRFWLALTFACLVSAGIGIDYYRFCRQYSVSANVFEGFLIGGGYRLSSIFHPINACFLICNAPFFDENAVYIIYRSGRKHWYWQSAVYIAFMILIYYLVVVLSAALVIAPVGYISNTWSSALRMLSDESDLYMLGNGVTYSHMVLELYSPLGAAFVQYALMSAYSAVIAFLFYALSYGGKRIWAFTVPVLLHAMMLIVYLDGFCAEYSLFTWLNLQAWCVADSVSKWRFVGSALCLDISFLLIGYQKVKKTDISNLASVWLS